MWQNEHLFSALLKVDENVAPFIFNKLNVNIQLLSQLIESQIKSYPK